MMYGVVSNFSFAKIFGYLVKLNIFIKNIRIH